MRVTFALLLALAIPAGSFAQEIDPQTGRLVDESFSAYTPLTYMLDHWDWFGRYVPRVGFRYDAGDSIGRRGGLSSFQGFFPLFEDDESDWLIFTDNHLLLDSEGGSLGANVGLGGRRYLPDWNRTVGGYLYYDNRDTGETAFNQLSAGFETLGNIWDARINGYFPVGTDRRFIGNLAGTENRFFENFLLVGGDRFFDVASTWKRGRGSRRSWGPTFTRSAVSTTSRDPPPRAAWRRSAGRPVSKAGCSTTSS